MSAAFWFQQLLNIIQLASFYMPLALAFGVASGADAAAGLVTAILAGVGFNPHRQQRRTPFEVASTEVGAETVFQLLGRIEHGVFG